MKKEQEGDAGVGVTSRAVTSRHARPPFRSFRRQSLRTSHRREGLPPSRSSTRRRQASEGTVGVTAAAPRCPPGPAPALLPESGRSSGSAALPGPETKGREERAGLAARPLPRAVTELTTPGPTLPPAEEPRLTGCFQGRKKI